MHTKCYTCSSFYAHSTQSSAVLPLCSATLLRMCRVVAAVLTSSFTPSVNRVKVFSVVTCSLRAKVRRDCLPLFRGGMRRQRRHSTTVRRANRDATLATRQFRVVTSAPSLSPSRHKTPEPGFPHWAHL